MPKKADTWMPWYVGDYLADTMLLTTEQHGAYCLLLMACWKEGGSLPADDETLAAITKLPVPTWKKYRDKLLQFFIVEEGTLHHKRVSLEVAKARGMVAQKSQAGKKGAARRWQKDSKPNGESDGKPIADAMADPMAEPMRGQWRLDAPSPSPLQNPITNTQALTTDAREMPEGVNCLPGHACRAMREAGIDRVNPSHPDVLELCAAGATMQEFSDAAKEAREKGKHFAYALGIMKGRRADAAKPAAAKTEKRPEVDHGKHAAVERA